MMVRIVKDPKERKAEIMDTAERLFETKGYEETSVNDILQEIGIAKGTFYYYFKSKDEIMDAVIERNIDRQIQGLITIVEDKQCNALEKLRRIIYENSKMNLENEEMLDYLHKPENIVMHQKSLVQAVQKFAPVLSKIIRQGIEEKLFQTDYPLQLSEFLMVGMNFLFDPSIFPWSREELITRMQTMADIFETTLRAKKGSFDFFRVFAQEMISPK
jgi:AcrR family transcriptional regulator